MAELEENVNVEVTEPVKEITGTDTTSYGNVAEVALNVVVVVEAEVALKVVEAEVVTEVVTAQAESVKAVVAEVVTEVVTAQTESVKAVVAEVVTAQAVSVKAVVAEMPIQIDEVFMVQQADSVKSVVTAVVAASDIMAQIEPVKSVVTAVVAATDIVAQAATIAVASTVALYTQDTLAAAVAVDSIDMLATTINNTIINIPASIITSIVNVPNMVISQTIDGLKMINESTLTLNQRKIALNLYKSNTVMIDIIKNTIINDTINNMIQINNIIGQLIKQLENIKIAGLIILGEDKKAVVLVLGHILISKIVLDESHRKNILVMYDNVADLTLETMIDISKIVNINVEKAIVEEVAITCCIGIFSGLLKSSLRSR